MGDDNKAFFDTLVRAYLEPAKCRDVVADASLRGDDLGDRVLLLTIAAAYIEGFAMGHGMPARELKDAWKKYCTENPDDLFNSFVPQIRDN